ncbi:RNA polymerase sigma factor [Streptomyces sp. NRRL S-87]|uniref:RNA polymerase sigma factor n=1 Tax=Streptomyces sp. NRRL S-87 TaxID=1463920 RepID=UPI0006925A19|nr:RNA polymerase sigma factor [Streptomyces sp. NRRL S-87]
MGEESGGSGVPRQRAPEDLSAQLIAAQEGDEGAFEKVFRAVQPGLLRYLTVLVGADAEDVASEAWLQIARDLGSFRGDFDNFRGWAATIARNRAMDMLRARRRRPAVSVPVEELLDRASGDDTEGAAIAGAGTAAALALIATLPRDQAEAVLLRVVMDLDAESAARVLGKRAGAVRMAAHRGLRKLAKLVERNPPPSSGAAASAPEAGRRAPERGRGRRSGQPEEKNSAKRVTRVKASTLKGVR